MSTKLNLNELHRIKQWHVDHREDHPMEYHLWDGMLTIWVLGWMGWLPAVAMDALWALPLCAVVFEASRERRQRLCGVVVPHRQVPP